MKQKIDRSERRKRFRDQVRENPKLAVVYFILRLLVILVLVAQFFNGNFENVFLCVLTLFLFTLPSFIERTIRIEIPDTLEVIILLFIFAAEILGEIQAYYVHYGNMPEMAAKASIFSALQLYLDFINLFLYILRFVGNKRN